PKDGKGALFLAGHLPLLRPAQETGPDRPIHDRLREVLAARGASFFPQLLAAARGGFAPELGDALWDLVWAGEVTNDTFHAVRALIAPLRRSRRSANSVGRAAHFRSLERFAIRDDVAGRWSLTAAAADAAFTPTERATAQVRELLERREGRKPMRTAGAVAILVDGRLAGWLGRGEEQLLTFIADEADGEATRAEIARALADEVNPDGRRTLFIETVDGAPVDETLLAGPLREAGFARTPRGYLQRVMHAGRRQAVSR